MASDVGPMAQPVVEKPDFTSPWSCRPRAPDNEEGCQERVDQDNVERNAAGRSRDCRLPNPSELPSLFHQLEVPLSAHAGGRSKPGEPPWVPPIPQHSRPPHAQEVALFHSLPILLGRYAIGRGNGEADPTAARPGATWIQSPENGAEKAAVHAEYWDPRSTGRTHRLANPSNIAEQHTGVRGVRSAPFFPGGRRKLAVAPWPPLDRIPASCHSRFRLPVQCRSVRRGNLLESEIVPLSGKSFHSTSVGFAENVGWATAGCLSGGVGALFSFVSIALVFGPLSKAASSAPTTTPSPALSCSESSRKLGGLRSMISARTTVDAFRGSTILLNRQKPQTAADSVSKGARVLR